MSIISLKRYMTDSKEDVIFRRTIATLMQGMVLHAVRGDQREHDKLNAAFNEIDCGLPEDAGANDLLKAAGAAMRSLADYNDQTTRFIHLQSTELHHMITMLTETVISIGAGAERSSGNLKEIEQQLKQAVALDEVQQIKHRLSECLMSVKQESIRQKTDATAVTERMRGDLERVQDRVLPPGTSGEVDKLTGLPMQADAELAISDAIEHPNGRTYVAAFQADRIQAINLRFGYAVGDRLLAAVAKSVRSQLAPTDRLFRWRGPGVVALIDRRESVELIRGQMARASVAPRDQMFDVGGRQVLIPVSAAWCLFPVTQPLEQICHRLHMFISGTPADAAAS